MKIIQLYSKLNIYLILFVALLTIILPSSESQKTDPKIQCKEVSKASDKNELIEYNDAKKCIESFPFDTKLAKDMIDAVSHFMSCYYVFLDQANEDPRKGFTYQRVDIIKELELLRKQAFKKTFKSDYDFMTALRNIIFKLKDGHTRVVNSCYHGFVYDQNLTLYSVVTTDKEKNKKQIIKVFNDILDPSNNECEVTEIDGKPALQAIIEFANNSISYSKDLGVRFNMALAPSIDSFSQQFTFRDDFPETPSIIYNLKCSKKSFKLKRKWAIKFDSAFENFCLRDASTSSSNVTKLTSGDKATESTSASRNKNNKKSKFKHAKLVTEDFYLVDNGTVGVAVITSENKNSIYALADGLDQLNKLGAKKLILDMSNNLGGQVSVVIFTILLLFRSQQQPNVFPTTTNINNFTIPTIKKNFKTHSSGFDWYNPYSYLSFPSGEPFKNASDFIGLQKNLTSSLDLDILTPDDKQLLDDTSSFRWTNEDIIIITNGFCISACALITLFLSEFHNVKTISVGGLLDTPMSFSTFPGGDATSANVIADSAGDTKFSDLPEGNSLLLTVRKAYDFDKISNITTGVLEYLFKPADYRLYYDENNARDPSFLWVDAANILNNEN